MKKKNDFKQKNISPERDVYHHKEKRAIPPVGDLQQEIWEMRQATRNLVSLPYEHHQSPPPPPRPVVEIPSSIEELYRRLRWIEARLNALEQRVAANASDDAEIRRIRVKESEEMMYLFVGGIVFIFLFAVLLSAC